MKTPCRKNQDSPRPPTIFWGPPRQVSRRVPRVDPQCETGKDNDPSYPTPILGRNPCLDRAVAQAPAHRHEERTSRHESALRCNHHS